MIYTSILQHTKNTKPIFFKFWANCILVNGYQRVIVYDIFRHRQITISCLFYSLFERYKTTPIDEIPNVISFKERNGYLKMLDYFVKNDFGIYTDNPPELPPLSMEYDAPHLTTTMVLKTNSDKDIDSFLDRIKTVSKSSVLSLQITDEGHMDLNTLNEVSKLTTQSTIECIHIYTHFSKKYKSSDFLFATQNLRFRKIAFLMAPISKSIEPLNESQGNIYFCEESIDFTNCGNIGKQYFITNQPFFIEAHSCNTCLNRKVSIDIDGNIGNCPLMPHTFGNIKDVSLREVVSRPEFQRLWHITKDQIDVCKDCEYRYICTDCRHFIKDKKNIYSQPSKCGYNPYIAKWSDEEGYVPVEDCGTYSTETGFIPDRQRIEAINRQLERNEQLEK